jgi:hypothetical protein
MMISKGFRSVNFEVVSQENASSTLIKTSGEGSWKTSSFYLDSSGRSSISVPLRLTFPSQESIDDFLSNTRIDLSNNTDVKEELVAADHGDKKDANPSEYQLSIEAKVTLTVGSGEAVAAAVEDVLLQSFAKESLSLILETTIFMRVSRANGEKLDTEGAASVKTNIEIAAVVNESLSGLSKEQHAREILDALHRGGIVGLSTAENNSHRLRQTRLTPVMLHVALTHAFSIAVRTVNPTSFEETLISLTIRHSNTHSEPVQITNVALHPSHSRVVDNGECDSAQRPNLVVDMSKSVQWGFANQDDTNLPRVLERNQAISLILRVMASDDVRSRIFVSPISVTANVGCYEPSKSQHTVLAAADAQWTSVRSAVEPSDAFRVQINVVETEVKVGAPFVLLLNVSNLSADPRDIELRLEKSKFVEDSVSVIGSQTVLFRGLDAGCSRDWSSLGDEHLLAMEQSLYLGEVKASEKTSAEIRFIALQPGTLNIPSFELHDRKSDKFYRCVHNVRIVATA